MRDILTALAILAILIAWTAYTGISLTRLLCRQTFGGVWSSIVIDDCTGSYWSPTRWHSDATDGGAGTAPYTIYVVDSRSPQPDVNHD